MDGEEAKTIDNVFPRIYVDLPNTGSVDLVLNDDDSPVEKRFGGDLVIFYAFDFGDYFELVPNRDLPRLDCTIEELHERALDNLRELDLNVRAHEADRVVMLTAGGDFEATLILLPEIWNAVEDMVEGTIVVSVPARDVVFFTGDADNENLSELRRVTSRSLEDADKPLSREFFRREAEQWVRHTGHAK